MILLKVFKIIALLEGISYLVLLGVGTPLKYFTGNDVIVKSLGMPHGILFMTYIVLAVLLKAPQKWSFKELGIILICSVLPFGTFYVDRKYLK